jgi:L-ribulose-5-phosphate 4-epimerase
MDDTKVKEEVCRLNKMIPVKNLAVWTGGNLSIRIPNDDHFYIKPSGVHYSELLPEMIVKCDLYGRSLEGNLTPSSDAQSHGYIYREMADVFGIIHTHSNYASAWAAANRSIPCVLTAIADEFGGDIPLGPFELIGNEKIGRGVVDTLKNSRSKAVLMRNHGVFAVGASGSAALKAAVMCEDVAKTVWIAQSLGELNQLPQEAIDDLYERYQSSYGQKGKE